MPYRTIPVTDRYGSEAGPARSHPSNELSIVESAISDSEGDSRISCGALQIHHHGTERSIDIPSVAIVDPVEKMVGCFTVGQLQFIHVATQLIPHRLKNRFTLKGALNPL